MEVPDEVFVGFPNQNSMLGFEKLRVLKLALREMPFLLLRAARTPGASALRGFAVIRKTQALGWDTRAEQILMRAVRKRASARRTHLVVLMNTVWSRTRGFAAGLFPVPSRLLPKKQLLMGMATGPRSRALFETPWRSQAGGWYDRGGCSPEFACASNCLSQLRNLALRDPRSCAQFGWVC